MKFQKTTSLLMIIIFSAVSSPVIEIAQAGNSEGNPLMEQLQSCGAKAEDSVRLACFDALAKTVADNKAAMALPKDLGGGKFDKTKKQPLANNGQLTSCKKSHDGRWLFYFESGQVWKQLSADRVKRRYKGCKYKVAIKKDGFGYKMYIDELSRKIRVKRLK